MSSYVLQHNTPSFAQLFVAGYRPNFGDMFPNSQSTTFFTFGRTFPMEKLKNIMRRNSATGENAKRRIASLLQLFMRTWHHSKTNNNNTKQTILLISTTSPDILRMTEANYLESSIVVESMILRYNDPLAPIVATEPQEVSSSSEGSIVSTATGTTAAPLLPALQTAVGDDYDGMENIEQVDSDVEEDDDDNEYEQTSHDKAYMKRQMKFTPQQNGTPRGEIDLLFLTESSRVDDGKESAPPAEISLPSPETTYSVEIKVRVLVPVQQVQFWEHVSSFAYTESFLTDIGNLRPKTQDELDESNVYTILIPAKKVQTSLYSKTKVVLRLESLKQPVFETSFVYEVKPMGRRSSLFDLASEMSESVIQKTKSLTRMLSFGKLSS